MRYDFQTFRGDLFGALTATVVALPVALALGAASGMGAVAGVHGSIARTLGTFDILGNLPDGHVTETLEDARRTAREILED